MQKEGSTNLEMITANNDQALKYFFIALILVICGLFLGFFLVKSFFEISEPTDFWVTALCLILLVILLYFIIKLISVPILVLVLKVTVGGGIILGIITSINSN